MADKNIIARLIEWLTCGYQPGVPHQERVMIMAVLRQHLSDEQLEEVIRKILISREARGEEYVSDNRINEYLRKVADYTPTPEDISRVAVMLGEHGMKIEEHHLKDAAPREEGVKYEGTEV